MSEAIFIDLSGGAGARDEPEAFDHAAEWHALPWILAMLGALAGLVAYLLLDGSGGEEPWRVGLAAFVVFGALTACFTLTARRMVQAVLFSLVVGAVLGGLAFHLQRSGDAVAGTEYAFAAGVLACALALPLFQAGFLEHRFATSYARTHFHVWSDAVAGAGAGAFALLSFLLLWLVDGLLGLVGITLIEELIQEGWPALAWAGGSFGAALGVLRNNLKVIGTLQAVALLVLALLAVPLAAALLVFLAALIASQGAALWEATDSATPVLLACGAGCFVFANAVIRDDDAARSPNRVMQAAALVLAIGILPLALFAAISMGARIDQHGLAPARLWALVAIGVAVAFGLAYLVAVARGRRAGWAERLRAANLRLAAGVCVLALLLALPIMDFGAISARNQVARLAAGKVSADAFDYQALRWDFGAAGRAALARLARGEGRAAELAAAARAQDERSYRPIDPGERERVLRNLRIEGGDRQLRRALTEFVADNSWRCPEPGCAAIVAGPITRGTHVVLVSGVNVAHLRVGADGVVNEISVLDGSLVATDLVPPARTPPAPGARVEVRRFSGRQVYVDGRPVGQPFQ